MHRYRRPASMRENGSGYNDRHAERGGGREEDIRPETLEAAFSHALPKPMPKRIIFLNKLAKWCNPIPERIESQ